ncbi:MAG: hypothetical protein ACRDN6_15600 [Gaiellaceae bacterium]
MTWVSIALLTCAVVVLVGAEWPRLERRFGVEARRTRERTRRKANFRLLRSEENEDPLRTETEEFTASVERDLSRLPTIEEREEENGRR